MASCESYGGVTMHLNIKGDRCIPEKKWFGKKAELIREDDIL